MTKIRQAVIAATVVGLAAFGIASPASAATVPGAGGHVGAVGSVSAIVLASNVVRRPGDTGTAHPGGNIVKAPVYDSAGKRVNRLPARSSGGKPRKMVCQNRGGNNICRPV